MILHINYMFKEIFEDPESEDLGMLNYESIELPDDVEKLELLIKEFQSENPELQINKYRCCNFEIKDENGDWLSREKLEHYLKKFAEFMTLRTYKEDSLEKTVIFYGKSEE